VISVHADGASLRGREKGPRLRGGHGQQHLRWTPMNEGSE
jgi:hypothetical protein